MTPTRKELFILFAVLAILAVGLPHQVFPAHASRTSCVYPTDCLVVPVVSSAFATGLGSVASEVKVDQQSGSYSDGGSTIYGGTNPNIYIGLMAGLTGAAQLSSNPVYNIRTMSIFITIRDSSGNVFSPDLDSTGHGGIGHVEWDAPYTSGDMDNGQVLLDLLDWFGGLVSPIPMPPDIKIPQQMPNGYFHNSTSIGVQWTLYPSPDSSGNIYSQYSKALKLEAIPNFLVPDVYTVSISTIAEQGLCYSNSKVGNGCLGAPNAGDIESQSYSFKYVYEADGGQDGDAANSLPSSGGNPPTIQHGSYTGFLYGIDTADVYGFHANSGEQVEFSVTPPPSADFGVALYDSTPTLLGTEDLGTGSTNGVAFTASASSTYYAIVSLTSGSGLYSFSLTDTFQMSVNPTLVSLGLVGTGASATSTIELSSPTDFSGDVTFTTPTVTPSVSNGPTASLQTITKTGTVTASPGVVESTSCTPVNPSYAFANDAKYANFDSANCGGNSPGQTWASYGGYSVSLPSGATITDVQISAKHYEKYDGSSGSGSVTVIAIPSSKNNNGNCGQGFCEYGVPFQSKDTTDSIDIFSSQSTWTSATVSNLQPAYFTSGTGNYYTSNLDWLPLQVTYQYTTTTVTLPAGGSDSRTLSIASSPNTPAGSYTVSVTGTGGGVSYSIQVVAQVQDFQITANPASFTIPPGQSETSTITVLPINGFSGAVTISANPPSGIQTRFSTNTINGGSGTSTLTLSLSSAPNPDPATVTVTATSGTVKRTVTISVLNPPPTFSLSVTPSPVVRSAGQSTTLTITATSLYGFSGTISLNGVAPSGLTCSTPNPSSITLTSSTTSSTSTMTCNAQAGLYTLNMTGTSGSAATYTLVPFTLQDYAIVATSPTAVIMGSSAVSTITITAQEGFAGTISLSDTPLPTGLSCLALSPPSVTPVPAGPSQPPSQATSTLSCKASAGGTYTVNLATSSGSLGHSVTATFSFIGFTITASQNTQANLAGPTVSSAIVLTSFNGFTGTVNLSNSISPGTGLTCNLFPLSLSLSSTTTSASSLLSCNGTPGNYTVTVTATSGSLGNVITLPFVSFQQTMAFSGVTATVNTIFTQPSPTNNILYGTTSLTETGASSMSSTVSMSVSSSDNVAAWFVAETPNSPYWLSVNCIVKINAASGCNFARTLDVAYQGTGQINIVDEATAAAAFGSYPNSPKWNPAADVENRGTVDIVDLATIANWFDKQAFLMTPSIVSLSSQSTYLVFPTGSSLSTTITSTSQNRLSNTLSLTASVVPSGASCSLTPSSGTLSGGGILTSTLMCNSSTPGTYSVTIAGSNSAGLGNFVLVHLNVTDFGISSTPSSFSFTAGTSGSGTVNLSLASLYWFSGTVSLSSTPPSGIQVSCQSPVSLSAGSIVTVGCSLSTTTSLAGGSYTVMITGTTSGLSHSTSVIVNIQDFAISENPNNPSIPEGTTTQVTISLTSLGSFSGTVTLTVTSIDGANLCAYWGTASTNCNTGSNSVSLTPNGASATLNVSANKPSKKGLYTILVTATSGSLSHLLSFTVTIG